MFAVLGSPTSLSFPHTERSGFIWDRWLEENIYTSYFCFILQDLHPFQRGHPICGPASLELGVEHHHNDQCHHCHDCVPSAAL